MLSRPLVDQQRFIQPDGQVQLLGKDLLLGVRFGEVPLVVQAAGTNRHALLRLGNVLQVEPCGRLLHNGLGVVRMDASSRVDDVGIDAREAQRFLARFDRSAVNHEFLNT